MIYVGIDAASNKHDVCIIDENGTIIEKPFQMKNNAEDYKKLLYILIKYKEPNNNLSVKLGIESTGAYSETVVDYFHKFKRIDIIYINPILTNMYQKTQKIHYAKTDKCDANGIANYISVVKRLRVYTPPTSKLRKARELYRELISVNKEICECKNRLKSLIHRYFPEFLDIFTDIFCNSSLYILDNLDSLETLSKENPELFAKKINKKSGGKISALKIEKIINSAKDSVGVKDAFNNVVVQTLVQRINILIECKNKLLETAEVYVNELQPNILSVPGIGVISGIGIISEFGDVNNFKSFNEFYAFTGLDPKVYQSGKIDIKNTRISKKGSPYLRNALFIASQCVSRFEPIFKSFYNKKIAEGKKHRVVLGHVAKKLCRMIFHLLKNNDNYQLQSI